jgi:hypothetical protein
MFLKIELGVVRRTMIRSRARSGRLILERPAGTSVVLARQGRAGTLGRSFLSLFRIF